MLPIDDLRLQYIALPLHLLRVQEFKDTSEGRMLFAVTEACAHDFQLEGHLRYSQYRPAAKIIFEARGFT